MNITNRLERNKKIAEYLCTVVGQDNHGNPRYHTFEEAATEFNLAATHIFKIKKEYIGLDNGERHIIKNG